jgi:hypothetical protein
VSRMRRVVVPFAALTAAAVLGAVPAGAAPMKPAAPVKPTACPTGAAEIFMNHFNSEHLGKSLFGAGSITADPAAWFAAHQGLFAAMASKAAGSC